MESERVAWFAGLIDGEGSVQMRCTSGRHWGPVLMIRMTDRSTVEVSADVVAWLAPMSPRPKVCLERRAGRQSDSFYIQVAGLRRMLALALRLEDLSVTKRFQWGIVREWCVSRLSHDNPRTPYTAEEREIIDYAQGMNARGRDKGVR